MADKKKSLKDRMKAKRRFELIEALRKKTSKDFDPNVQFGKTIRRAITGPTGKTDKKDSRTKITGPGVLTEQERAKLRKKKRQK